MSPSRTVLVVDDEAQILRLITRVLEVLLGRIGGRFLYKPFVPKSLLRMLEPAGSNRPDRIGSSNFAGPEGG